jgi:hypothetical protein
MLDSLSAWNSKNVISRSFLWAKGRGNVLTVRPGRSTIFRRVEKEFFSGKFIMFEAAGTEEVWELVENFFRAREVFEQQYQRYERLIKKYTKQSRVGREKLRLSAEKASGLLDSKALEELRDDYLQRLREISHRMFRKGDTIELFDKYVSDLYHETSILKEEHYAVKMLATLYEKGEQKDLLERDKILDEAYDFFPRKMRQIRNLFLKAQEQIELLMKGWNKEKVLVRSLYLFGDEVLGNSYKSGLEGLYSVMYPRGGALEGYLVAAESFASSSFSEQAMESLKRAKGAAKETKLSNGEVKQIRRRIREVEKSSRLASV